MQDTLSSGLLELYKMFSLEAPVVTKDMKNIVLSNCNLYTDKELIIFLKTGKKIQKSEVVYSAVPLK